MTFTNFIIEFSLGAVFGAAGMWIFAQNTIEGLRWLLDVADRAAALTTENVRILKDGLHDAIESLKHMRTIRDKLHASEERAFHLAKTVNKWRPVRGDRGRFVRK